jgi:hypothetical protein
MSISMPAQGERGNASLITQAVDARGQVWAHSDPLALYRFLLARNLLLETIAACEKDRDL